jgi:hypothetical protein
MKISEKSLIPVDDRIEARAILNRLKMGDRLFGNAAEGLKKTLKNMEKKHEQEEESKSKLSYDIVDGEYKQDHARLLAGIRGEEQLAEWIGRVVKLDPELGDLIFFASLSDPEQNSGGDDYISDSDFLVVYGKHVLILDAKNIITNADIPIYLFPKEDNPGIFSLCAAGGKEILDVHPSTHIWKNILQKNGVKIESIDGYVVIVNNQGACIWRNDYWYQSQAKPLHISELVGELKDWVHKCNSEDGSDNPVVPLPLLLAISKMQIKKEKNLGLDVDAIKSKFGL